MFWGCEPLAALDVSSWRTSSVANMDGMLESCSLLASIKVGTGYAIKSADMFPDATAGNGKWWSTTEGVWYIKDKIVSKRSKKADTYRNAEGAATTDISAATIEAIPNKSYTESAIKPKPTVTLDGAVLVNGTDYSLTWKNNTDVGKATVTVTDKGDYTGTKKATFKVVARSVSTATVVLSTTSYTYSGSPKKPKVSAVTIGATGFVANTDYTFPYEDNVNAGTATATITGTGDDKGTATAEFTITAKSLKRATVTPEKASCAYTGAAIKPSVTVALGTKDLTEGKDYTVTYKSNVGVGEATVTVKGTGNYKGKAYGTFKVVPARPALSKVTPGTGYFRASRKAASAGGAIDGWQVQRATDASFKQDSKTYKVADPAATSKKLTGLASGTTYHVRVRTYRVVGGKTCYSGWSKAMCATVKQPRLKV